MGQFKKRILYLIRKIERLNN